MVAPLMKHFFNVMYCHFLTKTSVFFSFYLSCFGLKEEEAITQISKKETEAIAWIKLLSHWNPGPVICKFSQTRIHPQCLEQWQICFNLCIFLMCAQYDLSCNARFLEFVWIAFNKDWIKMPSFFCKVKFLRNFIFISILNFKCSKSLWK